MSETEENERCRLCRRQGRRQPERCPAMEEHPIHSRCMYPSEGRYEVYEPQWYFAVYDYERLRLSCSRRLA